MKKIILMSKTFGEKECFIDDADYESVNKFKWYPFKGHNTFYAARMEYSTGKGRIQLMHRVILGITKREILCDHIDHDGLNNQRCNLRKCSNTENSRNSSKVKNAASKYLGVHVNKVDGRSYWRAQIMFNRKHVNIGNFKTEEDAARAYDIKAIELFGEFANINFKAA